MANEPDTDMSRSYCETPIVEAIRTYDQLDETQQEKAREKALNALLGAIVKGGLRFNDELNADDLQARIDAAWEKANDMQTPWFASEYIMDAAGDDIKGMAEGNAQDALYCVSPDVEVVDLSPTVYDTALEARRAGTECKREAGD